MVHYAVRCAPALLSVLLVAGVASAAPAEATPTPTPTPAASASGVPAGSSAPVTTPSTVTVTGTVLDDTGQPVPGATVAGWRDPSAHTSTAADGSYSLVVSTSEDLVCADGTDAGGSPFGYSTRCAAIPDTRAGGTATVAITLFIEGRVTGRVVDADGAPLHDVAIRINNTDTAGVTAADGTYAIRSVSPGDDSAVCGVGAGDHGGGSATGYLDACAHVDVVARRSMAAPDIVLNQPGGAITGTVRDGKRGAGLAGVEVWADDTQGGNNRVATTTRADGTYSLLGLVTQTFEVCFDGSSATGGAGTGGYGNQCWKYKDQTQGFGSTPSTPVGVTAGSAVSGIDGALPRWGAIAGRITDPAARAVPGVRVSVAPSDDWISRTYATTDAGGRYRIASLPPGDYAVCVQPGDYTSSRTSYLDYCVGADGPGELFDAPTAAMVTGNTTQTVDDTLVPAGRLSGVVVDSAGRGIRGAVVSISHVDGNSVAVVTADGQGRWIADTDTLGGDNGATSGRRLVPGDYDVTISGPVHGDYVAIGHPSMAIVDGTGYGTQTPVTVTGGASTAITDTLFHAGTLRGAVTAPGGAALGSAAVSIAFPGGDPAESGEGPYRFVESDGTWQVPGLPPGTYSLCVTDYEHTSAAPAGFLGRCPSGTGADGVTTTVTLAEGGTATVSTTLSPAGGVAGRVTTQSGHAVSWAQVRVMNSDAVVANGTSNADGSFEIDRVVPGTYTVCASGGVDRGDTSSTQAWASRCWGAAVGAPGAAVTVTAGAVRPGLGIVLTAGGYLGGAVVDSAGHGIAGAQVTITGTGAGSHRFPVTSDQWGSWQLPVPAGRYTVCASATDHAPACYVRAGGSSPSTVVLTKGQRIGGIDVVLP